MSREIGCQPATTLMRRPLRGLLSSPRVGAVAAPLLFAILSAGTYGRALSFAFLNDDTAHLMALRGATWSEALTISWTATDSAYCRPLGSLVLYALQWAFGNDPAPFYAFSLLLHGLNGWLLWRLARRLGGSGYALLASVAWLLFPTHYEAVAYVAALFHPLSVLLVLLTLSAGNQALERGGLWWLLTGLGVCLAPLAHEQAIVAPLLLLAWHWARCPILGQREGWRAWVRTPTPYFLLLLPPILALRARLGGGLTDAIMPTWSNTWAGMQHLARLYAYPLAWLGGTAGGQALWGAGLLALSLAVAWRTQRRAAILGLVWLVVTAMPMVLLISAEYLPSSPRLHYLSAVGSCLLWAAVPASLQREAGAYARPLAVAVTALWLATTWLGPLPYLRCALEALQRASAVVRAVVAVAWQVPATGSGVVVNAPAFFISDCSSLGPCRGGYPYATAGVVVMPSYARVDEVVEVNGGPERSLRTVSYPGYAPQWATHGPLVSALSLRRALAHGESVVVVEIQPPAAYDLSAAWRKLPDKPGLGDLDAYLLPLVDPAEFAKPAELHAATPHGGRWYDLVLVGHRLDQACLPGEELTLALYWRPEQAEALAGLSVELRLRDRYGNVLVSQTEAMIADYTADMWVEAQHYATRLAIPVPPNAALGPGWVDVRLLRHELVLPPFAAPSPPDGEGWVPVGEVLIGRAHLVEAMGPGARPSGAVWEGGVRLEGWTLASLEARCGDDLGVILYWRAVEALEEDLTIFLHLVGPDGRLLAQHDGEPATGQFPTSFWPVDALVADLRMLAVPADAPLGSARLVVGLYRQPSLQRLIALVPGEGSADHVVLGEVAIAR